MRFPYALLCLCAACGGTVTLSPNQSAGGAPSESVATVALGTGGASPPAGGRHRMGHANHRPILFGVVLVVGILSQYLR